MANFGWYAVAASLFSSSMINLAAKFGLVLNAAVWSPVLGCLCVVLGTLIALGGPNVIKWTNRFLVTALLAVGVVVVVLCFTAVPLREIVAVKPVLDADMTPLQAFMISAEGNVAFAFSWSTQALVLPRLAKTERGGYWGTTLAYGVVAPFFVAAGGVMVLAMFVRTGVYESDPTNMLSYLCGSGFALLSLLLVAFANVDTQGTGSYVNCMIVKSGMPKVSYKVLVLIAMVYVSALTVWGGVEEHFGAFISIAAFIQAPIIGMIVVDYLVVKKRKLSLKAAYFIEGHDAYRFTGGFNLVGIGCDGAGGDAFVPHAYQHGRDGQSVDSCGNLGNIRRRRRMGFGCGLSASCLDQHASGDLDWRRDGREFHRGGLPGHGQRRRSVH